MNWTRIVLGALLLEGVLFVVLVPLGLVMGNPFSLDPDMRTQDSTAYFAAVAVGCFVLGYLVARWMLRKVSSRLLLHGALIGVLATGIYLALAAAQPDGIAFVVAGYGPVLFWGMNALRIAGCVAGAAHRPRVTVR